MMPAGRLLLAVERSQSQVFAASSFDGPQLPPRSCRGLQLTIGLMQWPRSMRFLSLGSPH
jgi:hypothetical protein